MWAEDGAGAGQWVYGISKYREVGFGLNSLYCIIFKLCSMRCPPEVLSLKYNNTLISTYKRWVNSNDNLWSQWEWIHMRKLLRSKNQTRDRSKVLMGCMSPRRVMTKV